MCEISTIENSIIHGDCLNVMAEIPSNSIDLVVTSPPYAEKRKNSYGGISADKYAQWMLDVSDEIMRILKPTGSFVLNIKEGAKDGCRELYVLEYQLMMAKKYNWVDTFIWNKTNPFPTGSKKRLKDGFEYCFHFTKTNQYKFFPNEVLFKSESKWNRTGTLRSNKGKHGSKNGSGLTMSTRVFDEYVRPSNVLTLSSSNINIAHCAAFPMALPEFFIKLMTEENDIVLDLFMGSGTSAIACINTNRRYFGIEQKQEYFDAINNRIQELDRK